MEFAMSDKRKDADEGDRVPAPPRPQASIDLPRPTPDQAEYLSQLQASERQDYDDKTVIGGPRRQKA